MLRTSDINCAAALICTGHQLSGIEPITPYRGNFKFPKTEANEEAMHQYAFGSLMVDALRYADTLRMLKGRLYDLRQNNAKLST